MSISFIGSTLSIVASTPASEDQTGYEALSYTEVGKIVSVGELGDESDEITFDLLKTGRRSRVNGVKDLGNIPVVVEHDAADAGQDIVRAGNNTNTTHTFKITDTDNIDYYFQGLLANYKMNAREANQYKGFSCVLRGQTGVTDVE